MVTSALLLNYVYNYFGLHRYLAVKKSVLTALVYKIFDLFDQKHSVGNRKI